MVSLAQQAGATLSSRANGVDVFDAVGMQSAGLKSLTVVLHEGKFALARYSSRLGAVST